MSEVVAVAADAAGDVGAQAAQAGVLPQLRVMLIDGRWKAGDTLPGERDLASELGCSRASLREALRVLEAQGIIDSKPGGRSRVRSSARSAFGSVLELQLALGQYTTVELLHARVAVEMWSAREAARLRTDEQLEELRRILTRMGDPTIHVREFNALDAEFHGLIAAAARNNILLDLHGGLRSAIERQMVQAYDALGDWWESTHTVRSEHWHIYEALLRRDGELAAALARSHITTFFRPALDGEARLF